jgi:hypothetical protein
MGARSKATSTQQPSKKMTKNESAKKLWTLPMRSEAEMWKKSSHRKTDGLGLALSLTRRNETLFGGPT